MQPSPKRCANHQRRFKVASTRSTTITWRGLDQERSTGSKRWPVLFIRRVQTMSDFQFKRNVCGFIGAPKSRDAAKDSNFVRAAGGALLLAIVLMSLIGSEQLPARASLCALASLGTTPCGLTRDQFDILFQIRLPTNFTGCRSRWLTGDGRRRLPGIATKPTRRALPAGISNGAAVGTMSR